MQFKRHCIIALPHFNRWQSNVKYGEYDSLLYIQRLHSRVEAMGCQQLDTLLYPLQNEACAEIQNGINEIITNASNHIQPSTATYHVAISHLFNSILLYTIHNHSFNTMKKNNNHYTFDYHNTTVLFPLTIHSLSSYASVVHWNCLLLLLHIATTPRWSWLEWFCGDDWTDIYAQRSPAIQCDY